MSLTVGLPPRSVIYTLRLEGFVALAGAVAAYWFVGGNWWLFAVLLFAPDLSMLGMLAGEKIGATIYNAVHTYTVPVVLGAIGWAGGIGWLVAGALIWIAHIGIDRTLGYGLKYPGSFRQTHLGEMGRSKKADTIANAG